MDFLRLNIDVKRMILDQLSPPDLANVCATHTQLCELARVVLYSSVELPSGVNCHPPPQRHHLTSFVRAVVSRPHLGTLIRRLSFLKACNDDLPHAYRSDHKTPPRLEIPDPDMEAAVQFIKRCDVSYRDAWLEALQTTPIDAYLAILLLNLPAVTQLRIEPILLIETEFFGRVLRSLFCNMDPILNLGNRVGHAGTLQALHDIALYREDHSPIPNTPNILPVFYLPSAKRISIYLDDPAGEFLWPTGTPPRSSSLESLEVEGLHERHLGNLLSGTPALPSLTYIREYFVEQVVSQGPLMLRPVINLHSLSLSLATVKDTLTTLQLRTIGWVAFGDRLGSDTDAVVSFEGPLGSLSFTEFANLKLLEVPCEFIMGFPAKPVLRDHLPASLEELRLSTEASNTFWLEHEFDESTELPFLEGILAWLEEAKAVTPRIEKFIYLAHSYGGDYDWLDPPHQTARMMIWEETQRAGIEYTRYSFSHQAKGWIEVDESPRLEESDED